MTSHHHITLAAVVSTSALLTGCGISDPYQTIRTPTSLTTTTTATATTPAADARDPAPERGGTIPTTALRPQQQVAADAGSLTARDAVVRYARAYINWTAHTLGADQRRLAAMSVGAARLAAEQQASSAAIERTVRAHHLANRGQLLSVEPGEGVERGRWVIVTRERTTGTGSYHALPYGLHITLATTTHTPQGWVISQWSPQT